MYLCKWYLAKNCLPVYVMMVVIVQVLVYLYVKVLRILSICVFVYYFVSPVMLGVTISIYYNPFSLVMGGSVCDQCHGCFTSD